MGESLSFLFFFLPFSFSLIYYDTNGNLLELLNTLVILFINLLFRNLFNREYEGSEAHYCRLARNMNRARPISPAIYEV